MQYISICIMEFEVYVLTFELFKANNTHKMISKAIYNLQQDNIPVDDINVHTYITKRAKLNEDEYLQTSCYTWCSFQTMLAYLKQLEDLDKEENEKRELFIKKRTKTLSIINKRLTDYQKAANEKAALEAELKAKADKEAAELKAKQEAEKQAKLEAEKAAKAPRKEKLQKWVGSFEIPIFENDEVAANITARFNSFKKWAESEISNI